MAEDDQDYLDRLAEVEAKRARGPPWKRPMSFRRGFVAIGGLIYVLGLAIAYFFQDD